MIVFVFSVSNSPSSIEVRQPVGCFCEDVQMEAGSDFSRDQNLSALPIGPIRPRLSGQQ